MQYVDVDIMVNIWDMGTDNQSGWVLATFVGTITTAEYFAICLWHTCINIVKSSSVLKDYH